MVMTVFWLLYKLSGQRTKQNRDHESSTTRRQLLTGRRHQTIIKETMKSKIRRAVRKNMSHTLWMLMQTIGNFSTTSSRLLGSKHIKLIRVRKSAIVLSRE